LATFSIDSKPESKSELFDTHKEFLKITFSFKLEIFEDKRIESYQVVKIAAPSLALRSTPINILHMMRRTLLGAFFTFTLFYA
jgi:hypothetical protein